MRGWDSCCWEPVVNWFGYLVLPSLGGSRLSMTSDWGAWARFFCKLKKWDKVRHHVGKIEGKCFTYCAIWLVLLVLGGSGFFVIEPTSWGLVLVQSLLCLGLRLFVLGCLIVLISSCLLVACLKIAWVELVAGRSLIREGQSGWRENFFLFIRDWWGGCSFLLSFEHLLLLHALSLQQYLVHPPAEIIKFEMGTCHWACVLLLCILFSINAFVICEVDIVNVILIICHGLSTN